jgi:hypothetical protein
VSTTIHATTRLALYLRDELRCLYCGASPPDVVLTLDHVHDRTNRWANLVTACWFCNSSKGDSTVEEFAARHGLDAGAIERRIARHVARDRDALIVAARNILRRPLPSWLVEMRQASQEAALRARRGERCPASPMLACPFCSESPCSCAPLVDELEPGAVEARG